MKPKPKKPQEGTRHAEKHAKSSRRHSQEDRPKSDQDWERDKQDESDSPYRKDQPQKSQPQEDDGNA
ncbi:MAG TPA: hypothetical protein VL860_05055 [Planctomycetota bacterium]|nr:hypothetical protein [Planctomycetota bacterium]